MDSEDEAGLMAIHVSDSDDTGAGAQPKKPRHSQTEEEFQVVRQQYRPKIEIGELWKGVILPLGEHVGKLEAQELLHAIEELYYFQRYAEASKFLDAVLQGVKASGLDTETRTMLNNYHFKIATKSQKSRQPHVALVLKRRGLANVGLVPKG